MLRASCQVSVKISVLKEIFVHHVMSFAVCHFAVVLFVPFHACSECDRDGACGAVEGDSHTDIVEMTY